MNANEKHEANLASADHVVAAPESANHTAADHPPAIPERLRDQSETEGRIGEGKNAGVRNTHSDVRNAPGGKGTQRSETSDQKHVADKRDPDVRVGAKGVMHLDIGETICLQPGNDCGS